ncbi:MAG TPA: thiamine-phosphate kinase [Myxococcales bacterium]|nr:thiamine-phosphate kinase [Myxococcales bacterium]
MPSEFELIDLFTRAFHPPPPPEGPGDDCAVLRPGRGKLCVKTDAVVQDVHFRTPPFTLEDVGHKALAVNLSDLAAMGARPRWFVCAIAMPRSFGAAEVRRLARGMSALARRAGIPLVGGNFTSARELSITITCAGEAARPLLRSGGRRGDFLYVSGALGGARLGLSPRAPAAARRQQRRPEPRLRLGLIAARYASAAIDLSDGLAQDLGHLCRASGAGAEVQVDLLPVFPGAGPGEALAGGEDYELLLAIPPARAAAFERACGRAGERVTRIGRLGGERLRFLHGTHPMAAPPGFDHFRRALRPEAGGRARPGI